MYSRAILSISKQTVKPEIVILINDGISFNQDNLQEINKYLTGITFYILNNINEKGASGSWNTGIEYLCRKKFSGFIAIIDDDDTWENNHLELNIKSAKESLSDVVVSGLRMIKDNKDTCRKLPDNFITNDFLIGNPGWQGSNTFVSIEVLKKIRGFRNGLLSTNDRDLAFRILSLPNIRLSYTNQWTSSWFYESNSQSLSLAKSHSKLEGLRWFWYIYKGFFTEEISKSFFSRASKYFGIQKNEIINIQCKPKNITLLGDLNV